jgi:sugar lactone lactonase YvrE
VETVSDDGGVFTGLLALNPGRQRIVRVDPTDGRVDDFVTGVAAFPDGIVVDARRDTVYWTNMGSPRLPEDRPPRGEGDLDFHVPDGSIERVGIDGSHREIVVPSGRFVTGKQLAAAWSLDRLFFSDREGAAVRSVSLRTGEVRDEVVVADTEEGRRDERNQCVGVAVDERGGYLYWTQKGPPDGGEGRILRAPLAIPDGQSAEGRDVEVLWAGLPEPIDLELDGAAGVLYWTDRGAAPRGNTLNRADVPAVGRAGGAVDILSDGFGEAIGLAVDADVVYVSDLGGEIRAVGLDGRGDRRVAMVPGGLTGIAGI